MFKRHDLKNDKHFLEFLFNFSNLDKILRIFKTKIKFIAEIFGRLFSPRNVVTWIPESSCFRRPFHSQHVHLSQTLLKSAQQHFYSNFPLTWERLTKFTQNFEHFQRKDHVHSLNIWQVIEYEKCGYLNARELLFQNTLRESMCSLVANTEQICTAALLFKFPINNRQIELKNISVSQIWNLRTVW